MPDVLREKIEQFSSGQYGNENRLAARIQLYRYGQNPQSWRDWLFSRLDFTRAGTILEIGCGNGLFWQENAAKVPAGVKITLTDSSPGMVEAAREKLGSQGNFTFRVADADRPLPFADSVYGMVIANHMLYHVADLGLTLGEMNRVLASGGIGWATTLSCGNTNELSVLAQGFDRRFRLPFAAVIRNFNLENGAAILEKHFRRVESYLYTNLVVTGDVDALILYLASSYRERQLALLLARLEAFRVYLADYFSKNGHLRITNNNVLFTFGKK